MARLSIAIAIAANDPINAAMVSFEKQILLDIQIHKEKWVNIVVLFSPTNRLQGLLIASPEHSWIQANYTTNPRPEGYKTI